MGELLTGTELDGEINKTGPLTILPGKAIGKVLESVEAEPLALNDAGPLGGGGLERNIVEWKQDGWGHIVRSNISGSAKGNLFKI